MQKGFQDETNPDVNQALQKQYISGGDHAYDAFKWSSKSTSDLF